MDMQEAQQYIGERVTVSDGKPRPPDRFCRKVREWRRANYSGRLEEINLGYGRIVTSESPIMVVNVWENLDNVQAAD